MSEETKKRKSLRDRFKRSTKRLKNTYQLEIKRADTLAEVAVYKLTPLNLYILISTILVVFGVVVTALIAFTPLREYVPGYAEVSTSKELLKLHEEIEDLEIAMNAQKAYIKNFQMVMGGQIPTEEEEKMNNRQLKNLDSLVRPNTPMVDQLLREEAVARAQSVSYNTSNRLTNLNGAVEDLLFYPPVEGTINYGYSPERNHWGIDILAPKNTPIKAVSDGFVFFSDWTLETGNTVGIQHPNNVISFYKHNSALLKKAGSFVKAGEAIAIIGNTGTHSDGPHLHFELWLDGRTVDPSRLIQF